MKDQTQNKTYKELRASVLRRLSKLAGSPADADDLVQDAFVRFLRRRPEAKIDQTEAYLVKIGKNQAVELTRQRQRSILSYDSALLDRAYGEATPDSMSDGTDNPPPPSPLTADGQVPDPLGDPDATITGEELLARIPEKFAKHREALRLRYFEALANEQIATRLNTTPANVKKLLSRGLTILRAHTPAEPE